MVLHNKTEADIERFIADPGHGLLIAAPAGAGKTHVAQYIASKMLDRAPEKLNGYPYFLHIAPQNGAISIDAVRGVHDFLRLKTKGTSSLRRILIISDAHLLSAEAQNALLKQLEEPPADTLIILTTRSTRELLPTIPSRIRNLTLNAPPRDEILAYFSSQGFNEVDVTRAYHITEGRPGIMHAILSHDSEHPLLAYINLAKEIIKEPAQKRLLRVGQLAGKEYSIELLLGGLYSVAHAALLQTINKGSQAEVKRLYNICRLIHHFETVAPQKPSTKLLLTDLFLAI
jgi:replication-associated recombination protein RarA